MEASGLAEGPQALIVFGRWIVLKRWSRLSAFQGQSREVICERYEQGGRGLSAGNTLNAIVCTTDRAIS